MSLDQSQAINPSEDFDAFLDVYYQHLPQDELDQYGRDVLAARALAHRELGASRDPDDARVGLRQEDAASVLQIVTDDMPFLVDSVTAELVRQKRPIRLVVHPMMVVTRDVETHEIATTAQVPGHVGQTSGDTAALPSLAAFTAQSGTTTRLESWIAVEIARVDDAEAQDVISGIRKVLKDVRDAVADWRPMRAKAAEIARELAELPSEFNIEGTASASALLRWMDDGNFTFLGYREYELLSQDGENVLEADTKSGLGLMREFTGSSHVQHLTPSGEAKAREKSALVITKTNSRSTVHRAAYMDYVGFKSFDEAGNVTGERRFIGLFATSAYTSSVRRVPIIREKVDAVLRASGFPSESHSGKDLLSIMETYPRDELFQMSVEELATTAQSILRLQERRKTTLILRPEVYGRFVSAVVFVPRDRYSTNVRLRLEEELRTTFSAESIDFEARMTESALTRVYFRIRVPRSLDPTTVDTSGLEDRLVRASRSWGEGVVTVLAEHFGEANSVGMADEWSEAFPAGYRVDYEVQDALTDIVRFEEAWNKVSNAPGRGKDNAIELHTYIPQGAEALEEDARVKLYLLEPRSLTQILPVFQNLGLEVLDERPFEIQTRSGREFYLYDLGLKYPASVNPLATGARLAESFAQALTGGIESDRFDRLVLAEGMTWRQVLILRSYAKYMRQMGNANSYGFIADTLLGNADVTRALISLFEARFDPQLPGAADTPDETRQAAVEQASEALTAALEAVTTLDADRALRTIAVLIEATLRTNYYQNKDYLSFKLNPSAIEGLPFPRPAYEIWVYSPRVEGVHLRFGKVARGGLRWSDRREDFRTEILGLVKAQMVKNAVIVPTGAKGGFFAKQLPDPAQDRAAWLDEGKESYKTFIRGLLDITDNLLTVDGVESVAHPVDVVRHDDDDTYLVVAADKGTAAFSDIANSISAEYGFWLGDAFASGGSIGYDHKAMGITARGAWESVKRHFSELDVDTQNEDFTVVGVGDMSGDVFGNGMLLSQHIRLVAAFDHRHIFLDPNPDAASSWAERKRLFELPRSSWDDYNRELISAGGGVFPRQSKSVPVSEEVRQALGLPEGTTRMSPPDLLRAILLAPTDLLYNGGIGTYIKASSESHAEVGDKTNDAIRVDGRDLRVKVVGEGGNLGMTQRGRIEAALQGVILNTDAIDNSAGVDCSDHEVNIKIFVDRMVRSGKLDAADRTELLMSMTDEVGALVLQDNIDQNILLVNDRQRVAEWSPSYERLMDWLDQTADLKRDIEALPTTEQLRQRVSNGQGLTSPELSVLAAYAKIELTQALLESELPDDPWFASTLRDYFPKVLTEKFSDELHTHPLRREIIATVVANDIINVGGITFAFRAIEETSASDAAVAKAFVAMREIYDLPTMLNQLNSLPASFPTAHWSKIHLDIRRLLDRVVRWVISHGAASGTIAETVEAFKPKVAQLRGSLQGYLRGSDLARYEAAYEKAQAWGLPEELGRRWAELFESFALLEVARIADQSDFEVAEITEMYFTVYERFSTDDLLERVSALPRDDRWQALARAALRDDLYSAVADMTRATLEVESDDPSTQGRQSAWEAQHAEQLERAKSMFSEVNALENDDMASLSVALRLLRSIVRR